MNIILILLLTFIFDTIIRIVLTPTILGYNHNNYSIHVNKIYESLLITCATFLVSILLVGDNLSSTINIYLIIALVSLFLITYYLINEQKFINDENYLLNIKEYNASILAKSNKVLDNPYISANTKKFINDTIDYNKKQLDIIDNLLDN